MSVPHIVRILNMSLTVLLQAAYYFSPLNNPSFIIFGPVQKPLYWFNSTSQLSGQYRLLQASLNAPGKKIRWNHKRFCSTRRVKRKTAQFLEEKKKQNRKKNTTQPTKRNTMKRKCSPAVKTLSSGSRCVPHYPLTWPPEWSCRWTFLPLRFPVSKPEVLYTKLAKVNAWSVGNI